jgi:hypothetical protein
MCAINSNFYVDIFNVWRCVNTERNCLIKWRPVVLCLVVVGLLVFVPNQVSSSTHPLDGIGGQIAPASGYRAVSVPVKVVFVGIDPTTVDLSYSKWNVNIPTTVYGQVLLPQPYLTGVTYKIAYSYVFADNTYKNKLVSYLQSIEVRKTATNPWFYYYVQDQFGYISQDFHSMNYVVYDANMAENWIYENQQDLGGFPSNGWTLMLMNLTELPSYTFKDYRDFLGSFRQGSPNGTAHYFGVGYRDADLGYQIRNRDFMSGWGGVHRLWFDDLSAGPCFMTYPEELPIQIALRDNNYDLHSTYGKLWFSEYLADYISQATLNIVTPPLLYEPMYSQTYSFHVHIFDDRTPAEKNEVDIRSTVHADVVTKAFQDLVPYSRVNVSISFEDLTNDPAFRAVVQSSYKYADSYTYGVEFAQPLRYGIIDARPLYQYLQDHMNTFEPSYRRDRIEFTVPVFAFAFSNETTMAFTGKWLVEPIGGVALGDVAFVSDSESDFLRGEQVIPVQPNKGLGFTHDIVHEAGHMLGLPHSFDYGPVGNFIKTPMSYFTWDYSFGQADKDALQRAHVDGIYLGVQLTMNQLAQKGADVSPIFSQLRDVDAKYNEMDYAAALGLVLKAESTANAMASSISQNTVLQGLNGNLTLYVTLAASLGLLIGVAVTWMVVKKRTLIPKPRARRPRRSTRRRRRA